MRNILIGILIGVSLTIATAATANSLKPKIVGGPGILEGVEVLDNNGDQVCEEPFWTEDGTISCA